MSTWGRGVVEIEKSDVFYGWSLLSNAFYRQVGFAQRLKEITRFVLTN